MDTTNLSLAAELVPKSYITQGAQELQRRAGLVRILLSQRVIPSRGWDESSIEYFLQQLSMMDSNNFTGACGAVYSKLVWRRHFGFGHGVGRSGDIAAVQPKAAGSSLLYRLTNRLALHATQLCGISRARACLVLPTATGMSIALVLLSLRASRPRGASYVIWSRIDQKSCFKAIVATGCEPVVIELERRGDELVTDVAAIEAAVARLGADAIVGVVSTTSCFAPRSPDDVVAVARLCAAAGVPHVINHAYGLQASRLCHIVDEACRLGRVDAIVASTDKNFLVPVGGALVVSPTPAVVEAVARSYPGRAALSPILDLFITLIELGTAGLATLLAERKAVAVELRRRISEIAARYGERLLESSANPISFAMSIDVISGRRPSASAAAGAVLCLKGTDVTSVSSAEASSETYLGSMLFSRGVSGTRVVSPTEVRRIDRWTFEGYGAQCNSYPCAYITAAAAIGMTRAEVETYCERLDATIIEYQKQMKSRLERSGQVPTAVDDRAASGAGVSAPPHSPRSSSSVRAPASDTFSSQPASEAAAAPAAAAAGIATGDQGE